MPRKPRKLLKDVVFRRPSEGADPREMKQKGGGI